MEKNHSNPFVLPGFGQSGEGAQNPLLASMEMMRKAWDGLASGGFGTSTMAPTLSDEELARRISDLRAVENWLRMNLTVLSNTIQGLEVQRATITTLKNFAASASKAGGGSPAISPLDVVLGLRSGTAAASAHAGKASASAQTTPDTNMPFDASAATEAAQAWWGTLQEQFNTLAAATTATMQGVAASVNPADGGQSKSASRKAGASKAKTAAAPRATAPKKAAVKRTRAVAKKATK